MQKLLFLVCVFFIFSCNSKDHPSGSKDSTNSTTSPVDSSSDVADSSYKGESLHDSDYGIFHSEITVKNSSLKFYLKTFSQESKIEIYKNPEETQHLQTISVSPDIDFSESYYNDALGKDLRTEDYNFDGYKDLLVIQNRGAHNEWFDMYLYDPKKSIFIKNEILSGLESPSRDSLKQEIYFIADGGYGAYSKGIYKWQNNKLVQTREEQQDATPSEEGEPSSYTRTISVSGEAGQLKIASQVFIFKENDKEIHSLKQGTWDEFDKDPYPLYVDSKEQVIRKTSKDGNCE